MRPASSQAEVLAAAVRCGYRPYRRVIVFAFAWVLGYEDPPRPSLTTLTAMTGMDRRTLTRNLAWLERASPVRVGRRRPARADAQRLHARTTYTVLISDELGASLSQQLGALAPLAGGGAVPSLGADGLVARGGGSQELGTPRPTDLDEDDRRRWRGLGAVVSDELGARGYRLTEDQAAEVARQVLSGRVVANPDAYLRRALRKSPQLYVPARGSPPPVPPQAPRQLSSEQIRNAISKGLTDDSPGYLRERSRAAARD